ncbi:DUF2272 domain-containing protein [Plastoroseomonas hellenica]|nr:DUF2272 domain-containing protein [Plastoroseomonas hellenica]
MRPQLLGLIPFFVAACAGPPAPAAPPASPLARAALAEWEAWGRVAVDGWPAMRPSDIVATPERFARLIEYWSAVPDGGAVVPRLVGLRAALLALQTEPNGGDATGGDGAGTAAAQLPPTPEDIGVYARPAWSAAFISAVARWAGIAESDLPSSSRHASYIDAVLERAITDPERAYFRPHAPEERVPAPGDLLCADRSTTPLMHWSMRLGEIGRPRAMHCDVVVRAGPGVVEAVGGNVEDLVVLRRLPADREGRVLPAPPGEASFVLILAARTAER